MTCVMSVFGDQRGEVVEEESKRNTEDGVFVLTTPLQLKWRSRNAKGSKAQTKTSSRAEPRSIIDQWNIPFGVLDSHQQTCFMKFRF